MIELIEGHFVIPKYFSSFRANILLCQSSKDIIPYRPHITIVMDHTNEIFHFSYIGMQAEIHNNFALYLYQVQSHSGLLHILGKESLLTQNYTYGRLI